MFFVKKTMSKNQHYSGATISSRYDNQKYGAIFFVDRKVNSASSSTTTAQQIHGKVHVLDPYHALICTRPPNNTGGETPTHRLHVQNIDHLFHLIEKLKLISHAQQPLTYSHIYYKMKAHVSTPTTSKKNNNNDDDNDNETIYNDTDEMKRKKRRRKQQQYHSDHEDDHDQYEHEKSESQHHIDDNNNNNNGNDSDSNLDSSDDDEAFDQGSVTSNRYIASVITPEQHAPKHIILNHSFYIPLTAVNPAESSDSQHIPTPNDQQLKDKYALRQRLKLDLVQQKTFLWDHYSYVPYDRLIRRFGGGSGENLEYIQSRVEHEMRKLFTSQYYKHQEPFLSLTRKEYETLYPEYGPLPVLQNFIHITCSEIYYPASGKYHSFFTTSTRATSTDDDDDRNHNKRQAVWMVQIFIHPLLRPPKPAYPVELHDHLRHSIVVQNPHTGIKQHFYNYDYTSRYSIRVLMKRWLFDDECVELYERYDHTSHISINTSLNVLIALYKQHICNNIIQHAIDTNNETFDIEKLYVKMREREEQQQQPQEITNNNHYDDDDKTIDDTTSTITNTDNHMVAVDDVETGALVAKQTTTTPDDLEVEPIQRSSDTIIQWIPLSKSKTSPSTALKKRNNSNTPKKKQRVGLKKKKNSDSDDEYRLAPHHGRQMQEFKIIPSPNTTDKNHNTHDDDDEYEPSNRLINITKKNKKKQHIFKKLKIERQYQRTQYRSLLKSIETHDRYYPQDNKKTYVVDAFKHFATTYIAPQNDIKLLYNSLVDILFTRFVSLDAALSKIIEPAHILVLARDDDEDINDESQEQQQQHIKIHIHPLLFFKLVYMLYLRDHKDTTNNPKHTHTFAETYALNIDAFDKDHVVCPIGKRNISRQFIMTFLRDKTCILTQNTLNNNHYINSSLFIL